MGTEKKVLEPLEEQANAPTETSNTDIFEVSTGINKQHENASDSRIPEIPPKEKDKLSGVRNGSVPKRKEFKEVSTQTFIPSRETIKENLIHEPEQSFGCVPASEVSLAKEKRQ